MPDLVVEPNGLWRMRFLMSLVGGFGGFAASVAENVAAGDCEEPVDLGKGVGRRA